MVERYRTRSALALYLSALSACANVAPGKDGAAPPDAIPEAVQIAGGAVTVGFVDGRIRESVQVEAYGIMKHPVTQSQYDECVKAGACKKVAEAACYTGGFDRFDMTSPDAPSICVGYDNAVDYCTWIGGQLPTLAEWLYAARGSQPQRHAWGDQPATCEQHPLAMQVPDGPTAVTDMLKPCHAGDETSFQLKVGAMEAAPSTRMHDALLVPAELLRGDANLPPVLCGAQVEQCMVYGRTAGAIEAVSVVSAAFPHSFRCTFEEN